MHGQICAYTPSVSHSHGASHKLNVIRIAVSKLVRLYRGCESDQRGSRVSFSAEDGEVEGVEGKGRKGKGREGKRGKERRRKPGAEGREAEEAAERIERIY